MGGSVDEGLWGRGGGMVVLGRGGQKQVQGRGLSGRIPPESRMRHVERQRRVGAGG